MGISSARRCFTGAAFVEPNGTAVTCSNGISATRQPRAATNTYARSFTHTYAARGHLQRAPDRRRSAAGQVVSADAHGDRAAAAVRAGGGLRQRAAAVLRRGVLRAINATTYTRPAELVSGAITMQPTRPRRSTSRHQWTARRRGHDADFLQWQLDGSGLGARKRHGKQAHEQTCEGDHGMPPGAGTCRRPALRIGVSRRDITRVNVARRTGKQTRAVVQAAAPAVGTTQHLARVGVLGPDVQHCRVAANAPFSTGAQRRDLGRSGSTAERRDFQLGREQ